LTLEEVCASTTRKTLAGFGLVSVFAAIVGGGVKGAGLEVPAVSSPARQGLLAGVGVLLVAAAVLAPRVNAPATAVLNDAGFWKQVFNVLPPAFIKEYPNPENVATNATLDAFQGSFRAGNDAADARQALIRDDHKRGDEEAASGGESLQIELCDISGISAPRKILTYKKRVEYAGRTFIIGWCAPVEIADSLLRDDVLLAKELGRQPVFELLPPLNEQSSLTVRRGASVTPATAEHQHP
jgi:hypothetical protein